MVCGFSLILSVHLVLTFLINECIYIHLGEFVVCSAIGRLSGRVCLFIHHRIEPFDYHCSTEDCGNNAHIVIGNGKCAMFCLTLNLSFYDCIYNCFARLPALI